LRLACPASCSLTNPQCAACVPNVSSPAGWNPMQCGAPGAASKPRGPPQLTAGAGPNAVNCAARASAVCGSSLNTHPSCGISMPACHNNFSTPLRLSSVFSFAPADCLCSRSNTPACLTRPQGAAEPAGRLATRRLKHWSAGLLANLHCPVPSTAPLLVTFGDIPLLVLLPVVSLCVVVHPGLGARERGQVQQRWTPCVCAAALVRLDCGRQRLARPEILKTHNSSWVGG
jgi:hypothetical protein